MMNVETVSAGVTLCRRSVIVQRVEHGHAMQGLVNVADEVDEPAQRVGLGRGVPSTRLEARGKQINSGDDVR